MLQNRFFLIGLLIYFMPSIVLFGYTFATIPRNESGYNGANYYPSTEYSPLFELVFGVAVILGLLLFFIELPVLMLIGTHTWFIIVPYFVITYGLLYLYWKRSKKIRPKITN